MVVCTSRRHGNTDYSGNICHDVTDKQQLQGADSAPFHGDRRSRNHQYLAFNYDTLQLPTLYWLFIQSLSLYIVYLSFQTLFFERFIACFKIKGNVGFFIASIDFIGYTGTVCVLLFKEYCSPNIDWMQFYNQFSGWVGIVAGIAFIGSAIYLMQRYKMEKQNLPTECYHPTDNATNAFPQIQSTPTGNE